MKVGLVLECGPQGPDELVCEYLIKQLRPGTTVTSATLTNKSILIRDCGTATANLLRSGCDRVVIVWDLRPTWGSRKAQPCRRRDRNAIFASLSAAGIASPNVFLVCIEAMLEAWLLADERALTERLHNPSHPRQIKRVRNPESVIDPKAALISLFRQHGRPDYTDRTDAIKIARAIPDWNRLRRCDTFARFALKAVDYRF